MWGRGGPAVEVVEVVLVELEDVSCLYYCTDYVYMQIPLAHGVLDLVLVILRPLYDPSAREMGAAQGDSGTEVPLKFP